MTKIKYSFFVIISVTVLIFSCKLFDNNPPSVSISSHESGQTVGEIVIIKVNTSDKYGVYKIELYVNDNMVETIKKKPYEFHWNTLDLEDGEYVIKVISYDTSDNFSESEPIVLVVNNKAFSPSEVSISSIEYGNGGFVITWNKSIDNDFQSYQLEKSIEPGMEDYTTIYNVTDINVLSYFNTDANPLVYQYYRITVTDTFGLETKGQISSSILDPIPNAVDITSVNYTLLEMIANWHKSSDTDFKQYTLFYSDSENGNKIVIDNYNDINTQSYTTNENWFWIEVEDTLGQTILGNGKSNQIDPPPMPINISSVTYDTNNMTVKWSESNENDFKKYILLYSETNGGITDTVLTSTDINLIEYITNDFDPNHDNWYWVTVEDFWGQTVKGNGKTNVTNISPYTPYNFNVTLNDNIYEISWSKNNESDFLSYTLYESEAENMSNKTQIFSTSNSSQNSTTTPVNDPTKYSYFELVTIDRWELSSSKIVKGNPFILFIKEYDFPISSTHSGKRYGIQQTNDGGYIITGDAPWGGGDQCIVMKTDKYGNKEWLNYYGLGEGVYICQTTDNGYIVLGRMHLDTGGGDIMKIDSQGNEIWIKDVYDHHSPHVNGGHQTNDNGYILLMNNEGTGASGNIELIKTDANGVKIWHRSYGGDWDSGWDVRQTSDNGFIITGKSIKQPIEYFKDYEIYLLKTNQNGIEQWSKTLPFDNAGDGDWLDVGLSVYETSDNGFLVFGRENGFQALIKTDSNGNVEWRQEDIGYGDILYYQRMFSINNNNFILIGSAISKIDEYGNNIWKSWPQNKYRPWEYSLIQSTDSGFAIVGETSGKLFLMKTDPWGEVE